MSQLIALPRPVGPSNPWSRRPTGDANGQRTSDVTPASRAVGSSAATSVARRPAAPGSSTAPRPSMGVVFTNRHARARDIAPEPDFDDENDLSANLSPDHAIDSIDTAAPAAAARSAAAQNQFLKTLRPRLVYLQRDDRILLELAMTGERSRRDIARTINLEPGNVTRRLQKILRRLSSGLVTALLDDGCPLAPEYRQLALEHFLGNHSQRELADLHHMTPGAVSRALHYVNGWYNGGRSPPGSTNHPATSSRRSRAIK